MKKTFTQLELMTLLKSNPLNLQVFLNEKGTTTLTNDDYIFVDAILDKNIKADDTVKAIINQIQIDIYVSDFDRFIETKRFIQSNFIALYEYLKEDHYNRGTFTTDVMIKEWGVCNVE